MRIKGAPAIMSQDAFCHLAPRWIPGAKNQNSFSHCKVFPF
jgi:hypothetical protein